MKGLPPELIYGLIIGAVLLFNYIMQRAARRQKIEEHPPFHEPPPDEEAPLVETLPPDEGIPELWGRRAKPAAVPAPVVEATAPPAPEYETHGAPSRLRGSRFTRASLLGSRRDVQRAIVVAAILGPCRAFEPHEVR